MRDACFVNNDKRSATHIYVKYENDLYDGSLTRLLLQTANCHLLNSITVRLVECMINILHENIRICSCLIDGIVHYFSYFSGKKSTLI